MGPRPSMEEAGPSPSWPCLAVKWTRRVGRPPLSGAEVEGHLAQNRSWEAAPRALSPRGRASDGWGQGEKTEALM